MIDYFFYLFVLFCSGLKEIVTVQRQFLDNRTSLIQPAHLTSQTTAGTHILIGHLLGSVWYIGTVYPTSPAQCEAVILAGTYFTLDIFGFYVVWVDHGVWPEDGLTILSVEFIFVTKGSTMGLIVLLTLHLLSWSSSEGLVGLTVGKMGRIFRFYILQKDYKSVALYGPFFNIPCCWHFSIHRYIYI